MIQKDILADELEEKSDAEEYEVFEEVRMKPIPQMYNIDQNRIYSMPAKPVFKSI